MGEGVLVYSVWDELVCDLVDVVFLEWDFGWAGTKY